MTTHKSLLTGGVAAAFLLGLMVRIGAGEEAATLAEGDYAAFAKLRFAVALSEEKGMFAHGSAAKRTAIAAQLEKTFAEAGWTRERFDEVSAAVDEVLMALRDAETGDDPAAARQQLAEMNKTTVATAKAHRKELEDEDGLRQRARDLMREEDLASRRGAAPTVEQITGKWVIDVDATLAALTAGMPADVQQKSAEEFRSRLTGSTYTFGPGDKLVATTQRPGLAPEAEEGAYRLEGNSLVILTKRGKREREHRVDVGMKDGCLRVGMMGVYSIFRRE